MLKVADPDIERMTAAPLKAVPVQPPKAHTDQRSKSHISETNTKSHNAAFETWLNAQLQDPESDPPDAGHLHEVTREASKPSRTSRQDGPVQYAG